MRPLDSTEKIYFVWFYFCVVFFIRQLEEDEDRFHKMQLTDQANFNDRLDTLQMVVAGKDDDG